MRRCTASLSLVDLQLVLLRIGVLHCTGMLLGALDLLAEELYFRPAHRPSRCLRQLVTCLVLCYYLEIRASSNSHSVTVDQRSSALCKKI